MLSSKTSRLQDAGHAVSVNARAGNCHLIDTGPCARVALLGRLATAASLIKRGGVFGRDELVHGRRLALLACPLRPGRRSHQRPSRCPSWCFVNNVGVNDSVKIYCAPTANTHGSRRTNHIYLPLALKQTQQRALMSNHLGSSGGGSSGGGGGGSANSPSKEDSSMAIGTEEQESGEQQSAAPVVNSAAALADPAPALSGASSASD